MNILLNNFILNLVFKNNSTDAERSAKHIYHYIVSLYDIKMNRIM